MANQNVDVEAVARSLVAKIFGWVKTVACACILVAILATAISLVGFNLPGVRTLELTQGTGIGMAGLAYLLERLKI